MSRRCTEGIKALVSALARGGSSYILGVAETRMEQLSREVEQAQKRLTFSILSIICLIGSGLLFLIFLGITLLLMVPVEERLTVAIWITGVYAITSVIAAIYLYVTFSQRKPLFEETIQDIKRVRRHLDP